MADMVTFRQSRLGVGAAFEFEDVRLKYAFSDRTGEREFYVPYENIDVVNPAKLTAQHAEPEPGAHRSRLSRGVHDRRHRRTLSDRTGAARSRHRHGRRGPGSRAAEAAGPQVDAVAAHAPGAGLGRIAGSGARRRTPRRDTCRRSGAVGAIGFARCLAASTSTKTRASSSSG